MASPCPSALSTTQRPSTESLSVGAKDDEGYSLTAGYGEGEEQELLRQAWLAIQAKHEARDEGLTNVKILALHWRSSGDTEVSFFEQVGDILKQMVSEESEELGDKFVEILESRLETTLDTSAPEEASFWTNIDCFKGNAMHGAVKTRLSSPPSDIPNELARGDPDFGLKWESVNLSLGSLDHPGSVTTPTPTELQSPVCNHAHEEEGATVAWTLGEDAGLLKMAWEKHVDNAPILPTSAVDLRPSNWEVFSMLRAETQGCAELEVAYRLPGSFRNYPETWVTHHRHELIQAIERQALHGRISAFTTQAEAISFRSSDIFRMNGSDLRSVLLKGSVSSSCACLKDHSHLTK